MKRELFFSIISRGWAALLGLLAVPLYVDSIGIERYGFVGLFLTVQALCALFDFGLGSTLAKALATLFVEDPGGRNARNTVRTFEWVMLGIGFALFLAITCGGRWAIDAWVGRHGLDSREVAEATILGAMAIFCIWPSTLYSMGLAGRQRLQVLGIALIITSSLRVLMTVLAIHLQPTLPAFFAAQALGGGLQSLVLRALLWRSMQANDQPAKFDLRLITSYASFAAGMTAISICGVLLAQVDKLVLSRILPLADFGYYALAATLATGLYIFISPVFLTLYTRFSTMAAQRDQAMLKGLYHDSSQILATLIFPIGAVLGFFAQDVLLLWTGNSDASYRGAAALSFLVIGTCLNGMMNIPYALQIAHGWTELPVMINLCALLFIVPASIVGATIYGGEGAAGAWLALNLFFLMIWPYCMHRRLLVGELQVWYLEAILRPVVIVVAVSILIQFALQSMVRSRITLLFLLPAIWMVLTTACVLGVPRARRQLTRWLVPLFARS